MDEFTMMYPKTLSSEGLDIAEQFLNNNLAGSSSYGVFSAKIKSDRNNLTTSNKNLIHLESLYMKMIMTLLSIELLLKIKVVF